MRWVLVLAMLFAGANHAGAQQADPAFARLQTILKANDALTVTTDDGTKVKGRMMEVSLDRIVLQVEGGPMNIAASRIVKVQRRKNGMLLGAIIGLGAGVPFAVFASEYSNNEGGGSAVAAIPILIGLGIGAGIDAAVPSRPTVYDGNSKKRVTIGPVLDRHRIGIGLALKF
jgi:hypothetical protein